MNATEYVEVYHKKTVFFAAENHGPQLLLLLYYKY